jgi:MFS family permease
MIVAFALPTLLDRLPERRVMLTGAALIAAALLAGGVVPTSFELLVGLWFIMGMGYSLAQTPSGRLLRKSSGPEDRPALFAAQFALSHACWLLTYPLAGWLGAKAGMATSFLTLGAVAVAAIVLASRLWHREDTTELAHQHPNLPAGHAHLVQGQNHGDPKAHSHEFFIDDQHPRWPS